MVAIQGYSFVSARDLIPDKVLDVLPYPVADDGLLPFDLLTLMFSWKLSFYNRYNVFPSVVQNSLLFLPGPLYAQPGSGMLKCENMHYCKKWEYYK